MYLEINLLSVNLPELAVLHAGGMTCLLVCVKQTSSANPCINTELLSICHDNLIKL